MAGGPSTPELVAAVSNAGGFGFLAAGYLTPAALAEQARATASLLHDGRSFGINIFCPDGAENSSATAAGSDSRETEWQEFRSRLEPVAMKLGVKLPESAKQSDDFYQEKVDAVLDPDFLDNPRSLEYVSFTFGYPTAEVIERVKATGRKVVLNATSIDGVRTATKAGADRIVLQGLAAGGHRGFVPDKDSSDAIAPTITALAQAVSEAVSSTDVDIVAAGGIGHHVDVVKLLDAGASAVQVGTRFLTAEEAGTKPTHRAALLKLKDRETMLTRAFSGKSARTIENAFSQEYSEVAPALYPELHYLTAPIKSESNKEGNPEYLNLWAGTGFPLCREQSAAEIVAELEGQR